MKMKEIKYNIKAALFRLKNSAVKVASGVLIVVTMPFASSCGNENETVSPHQRAQKEYIWADLGNLEAFKDEVRHSVVNKNADRSVAIKFTKDSKEKAAKATVQDWDEVYEPVFQEIEALANQHGKQIRFQDTVVLNRIDFDEATERDSVGVGGGKDLLGATYLDLRRMGIYFLPQNGRGPRK